MTNTEGQPPTVTSTAGPLPPDQWRPRRSPVPTSARTSGPTSIRESFTNYVQRVRGGDVGMLPAIIGLIVLVIIFANVSDKFLTKTNMAT